MATGNYRPSRMQLRENSSKNTCDSTANYFIRSSLSYDHQYMVFESSELNLAAEDRGHRLLLDRAVISPGSLEEGLLLIDISFWGWIRTSSRLADSRFRRFSCRRGDLGRWRRFHWWLEGEEGRGKDNTQN